MLPFFLFSLNYQLKSAFVNWVSVALLKEAKDRKTDAIDERVKREKNLHKSVSTLSTTRQENEIFNVIIY